MVDVRDPSVPIPPPETQPIRILNDLFRTQGVGNGMCLVSAGVKGLGDVFVNDALHAVREFNDFSEDNDPWNEHDCASVVVHGEKLIWKIDYYNPTLQRGSENPADESVTHRVLTIMLASEY